jgi:hypothetical protein
MTEPLAPLSDVARGRGRYPAYTRQRLADVARRLRRAIYPASAPVAAIEVAGPTDRISFEEAARLDYRPAKIGETLGPLWSTWWFRITAEIPPDWAGGRIDLHWDSASEALLWRDGRSVAGLNIGRHQVRLTEAATGGERLAFHVEVACNRAFGVDHGGGGRRGGPDEPYVLRACELRRFDPEAWRLFHDFDTLRQLEADRAPAQTSRSYGAAGAGVLRPALDTTWAGRLLHGLNRVCNLIDPDEPASWPAARPILDGLLAARNADVTHDLYAANYKDADRSGEAMYLFGYGDGGGGADAGMIERLTRGADLQGVPRTRIAAPEAFFERLEARADDLAAIEGELYFEYHCGTYTSQGEIKRLNRLNKHRRGPGPLRGSGSPLGRPLGTRVRGLAAQRFPLRLLGPGRRDGPQHGPCTDLARSPRRRGRAPLRLRPLSARGRLAGGRHRRRGRPVQPAAALGAEGAGERAANPAGIREPDPGGGRWGQAGGRRRGLGRANL